MRLNVEPEKIVSQILGDLINVEGTNEKLFSVFSTIFWFFRRNLMPSKSKSNSKHVCQTQLTFTH